MNGQQIYGPLYQCRSRELNSNRIYRAASSRQGNICQRTVKISAIHHKGSSQAHIGRSGSRRARKGFAKPYFATSNMAGHLTFSLASQTACLTQRTRRPSANRLKASRTYASVRGAAQQSAGKESLFSKLGGAPAVKAAVDIFYDKIMADDQLNYFFEGVDMKAQRAHQSAFLAYALGGTDRYGGNANMTSAHERLVKQYGLRMEHFDMILGHLGGALQDLNVPEEDIGEAAGVVETLRPAFQVAIDRAS